jgi:hypothetical protein
MRPPAPHFADAIEITSWEDVGELRRIGEKFKQRAAEMRDDPRWHQQEPEPPNPYSLENQLLERIDAVVDPKEQRHRELVFQLYEAERQMKEDERRKKAESSHEAARQLRSSSIGKLLLGG